MSRKIILYALIVGWFGGSIWIGEPYIGSVWGGFIFLSSWSFLCAFFIINSFKVKEIENKMPKESEIRNYSLLLISYFAIFMILYIVQSFKPPSLFLISLFFIYLILAIIWIHVFENKKFTGTSYCLLLLAIFPLITGLMLMSYEKPIENSIEILSNKINYYEDNLDNITNGLWTKNSIDNIKYSLQILKSDVSDAKKSYLIGDMSGSEKKLEHANKIDTKLDTYFKLLDPQTTLYDMLHSGDKRIDSLIVKSRNILSDSCMKLELEQIKDDINLTKIKLNNSWNKYREKDFQTSYNILNDVDKEITDIESRIDRCSEIPSTSFSIIIITIFIMCVLLILEYIAYSSYKDWKKEKR